MRQVNLIGFNFKAVAQDENERDYDASFQVIVMSDRGTTQAQVQYAVDFAKKQFHEYHPNGVILETQQVNRVLQTQGI